MALFYHSLVESEVHFELYSDFHTDYTDKVCEKYVL